MANIFIAKSMTFYPDYYEDKCQPISDQVIIPSHSLNIFLDRFNDDEDVFLMKLINTNNNKEVVVSIGIPHYYERDTIFAPQWILDMIDCTGNCSTPVKLVKLTEELPLATNIIIKPLDSMAFKVDLVECFQNVLQNLCTLQEGATIPVIIPELGNYEYFAYIDKVEPNKISKTHSDDLSVNFLRDFDDDNNTPNNIEETIPNIANSIVDNTANTDNTANIVNTDNTDNKVELSSEERRQMVRESWLKRFNK
jgi:hypothetical protein